MRRRHGQRGASQRLALTLGGRLVIIHGITISPAAWLEEAPPSLTAPTREFPSTAVITDPSVRVEKQTHSNRLSVKKPEQGAGLAKVPTVSAPRPSMRGRRVFWTLPRRQHHAARTGPVSPGDPSDTSPS